MLEIILFCAKNRRNFGWFFRKTYSNVVVDIAKKNPPTTDFPFPTHAAYMTAEKRRLENELDLYKPVLLALVVVLACTGVWLLVLALTGTDPACHLSWPIAPLVYEPKCGGGGGGCGVSANENSCAHLGDLEPK
jgi:hypothetical protein